MDRITRLWSPALLLQAVVLLTFVSAVCGDNERGGEDVPAVAVTGEESSAATPATDTVSDTPAVTTPTATPSAEPPGISRVSLDEYLGTVCGGHSEVSDWEEGESLRELSAGLGSISELMSGLNPPAELAEWHHAQIAFTGIFKEAVDDFLEDPAGRTEDDFVLSLFFTVGPHFESVEKAIGGMDPGLRARMVEAGCVDEELSGTVPTEPARTEVEVGGSVDGEFVEPEQPVYLQFQAETGQRYVLEVAWEGFPEIFMVIKDAPDPVVSHITWVDSETSPAVRRWTAPESGTFHIDVSAADGTGNFTVGVALDPNPDSPSAVTAVREGSSIKVSWDPVAGAEYYVVYHDERGPGCQLNEDGYPRFCDELASDLADTSYTHSTPDPDGNFYFVVACNNEGCSEIESYNPASP